MSYLYWRLTTMRHKAPTDYPTRARSYRAAAARARALGEETTARECEEFARRCDERAIQQSSHGSAPSAGLASSHR